MTTNHIDTVILGAGISGLSLGQELKRKNRSFQILDSSKKVGGVIQSSWHNDHLAEAGPNSLQITCQETQDFLNSLPLQGSILEPPAIAHKRFLFRSGQVLSVPGSPLQAITTPLFSFPAKLRLALEPFIRKRNSSLPDESLADFVRRRLGSEFLDYALNPMVGGIYAGDPERLSVRHAFPKVYNLEENYGGLIKGAIRLKKEKKKAGITFKTKMVAFEEGMHQLPETIASIIEDSIQLSCILVKIKKLEDQSWEILWKKGEQKHATIAKKLIITIPCHKISQLPFANPKATDFLFLNKLEHPPISSVTVSLPKEEIPHPLDGFGVLIPEIEKRNILGCLFNSSLFPNRAPKGSTTLTCFIGGTRQPELAPLQTDTLLEIVDKELRSLLKTRCSPTLVAHHYWEKSIPQYELNYEKFSKSMDLLEQNNSGLHFLGNYRNGIALEKCILGAIELSQNL